MKFTLSSVEGGKCVVVFNLYDAIFFTFEYLEQLETRTVKRNLGPLYGVERATVQAMFGSHIYIKYFRKKHTLEAVQIVAAVEKQEVESEAAVEVKVEEPPAVPDTTLGLQSTKTAADIVNEVVAEGESADELETEESDSSSASSLTSTYVLAGEVVNGEYVPTHPSTVKFLPLYQLGVVNTSKVIGKGTFGEVLKVMTLAQGSGVIKRVSRAEAPMVIREAELLKMMQHDNIIPLDGCYFDETSFILFFNTYCPTRLQDVSNNKTKRALIDIALAINYIHSKQVIHRDIKPSNIMIDEAGTVKLLDFGIAKLVSDRTFSECGTEGYMAPEIGRATGYTKSVDVYALAKTAENLLFFSGIEVFDQTFVNPVTRPNILQLRDMLSNHPDEE